MTAAADDLPGPLRAALSGAVEPGEVVRWVGRPGPVRDIGDEQFAGCVGWAWIIFAVPFTSWMVYSGHFAPNPESQGSLAYTLLVCTFFVGIGAMVTRVPARKRKRRANTVYAVTDRRAVVIETWWAVWWSWWRWPWVQSFGAAELGKLRRVDHPAGRGKLRRVPDPDGRGDVILVERVAGDGDIELHAFFNIAAAREVEALVRELLPPAEPAAAAGRP